MNELTSKLRLVLLLVSGLGLAVVLTGCKKAGESEDESTEALTDEVDSIVSSGDSDDPVDAGISPVDDPPTPKSGGSGDTGEGPVGDDDDDDDDTGDDDDDDTGDDDDDVTGDDDDDDDAPNTAPTISLTSLTSATESRLSGQTFQINFSAADTESSLTVSLYYGPTSSDCDAANIGDWTLITDSLTDSDSSHNWVTPALGTYAVCAHAIDDGALSDYEKSTGALYALPSSGQVWLKAETGVTKDGDDTVTVWADQSSLGRDAVQIDATDREPLYVASGINGLPSIHFDGTNDYFTSIGSMTGFDGRVVFAVFKVDSAAKDTADLGQIWGQYEGGGGGTGHVAVDYRSGSDHGFSFDGASGGSQAAADYILDEEGEVLGAKNTNSVPWIDDQRHYIQAKFTDDRSFDNYVIGHLGVASFSVTQHHFAGYIGEIIVFDDLSGPEIDQVATYLKAKWNLPVP